MKRPSVCVSPCPCFSTLCPLPRCRSVFSLSSPAVSQALQTLGSPAPPDPPASSFSALLQMAYTGQGQGQGQGPGTFPLLDEGVQGRLRAALLHLPTHQALRSARHLLLYLKSTVENFGQVSAAPAPWLHHLQRVWPSVGRVHAE